MEEKAQTAPAKKGALQILLPLLPAETTMINNLVGVRKKDNQFTISIFHANIQS